MELHDSIENIVLENPIRIVFSNKKNKSNEYEKVKINKKELKDREIYQLEKFTKT